MSCPHSLAVGNAPDGLWRCLACGATLDTRTVKIKHLVDGCTRRGRFDVVYLPRHPLPRPRRRRAEATP